MRIILSILIATFFFGLTPVMSQTHSLKGVIVDSLGGPMPGTTVVLTRASDSSMVKFALTDAEGAFRMNAVANGEYLLQMSYLGYQNFMMKVSMKEGDPAEKDLGKINMSEKTIEMDGVVIEADIIPIIFKKDTVEYNANAFKTQPDAKVEDLLKRMPGLEVDEEGNVTAHGEKVQKVLVDGKEFFGSDPKAATKNLPAKAVDKVQVFDKQSDMAEFTGVDDGERMRTINLKLREDYKQGMFGNAEAGAGTDEDLDPLRYKGRFSLNRFQKTTQISSLGMLNNVNEQGFGVQDYVDFMGGMGNAMRTMGQGGGGGGSSIPLSSNLNNGNVVSAAAGINFNYSPSKKTKLNASYFYSGLSNDVHRELLKTTFLESGTFTTTETNLQESGSGSHRLNIRFDQDLDSTQSITFKSTGLLQTGSNATNDDRQNLSSSSLLTNQAMALFSSDALNWSGEGELQYKKKFGKPGRSLGANVKATLGENWTEGMLDSRNYFYDPFTGTLMRVDTVLQDQQNEGGQLKYSGEVSYTEPIAKRYFLEGSASHGYQRNLSNKEIFDLDVTGLNPELNTQLSNRFENYYVTDVVGLSLQRSGVKSNLTVGVKGEMSDLRGNLVLSDTTLEKRFINALPRIRYRYQIAQSRRIEFNYNTNVSEPSISQLSPIVDNSDPTRVTMGNPDLRAQYIHNARLGFFSFSPFSFTSIFANVTGSYTHNKITNAVFVDSNLVQLVMPVNVKRDINVNGFAGFGAPIKPLGVKFNLNARTGYNRGLVYVNQSLADIDRLTQSGDFSIENRKKEKLDAKIGYKFTYSLTQYAQDAAPDQSFFNQEVYTDVTWDITDKWILGSTFSYNLYGGQAFGDQSVALWKAYLSRYFLPGNKLQIKLYAFDILNQNTGVNRSSDLNFVQEETFQTVNRYVMLSIGYNLMGFQKQQNQGPGMGRMMMRQ